jgi:hypothetical protein
VGEAATTYSWLYSSEYDPLKASPYSSGPSIVEQATKPRFAHPSRKMALGFFSLEQQPPSIWLEHLQQAPLYRGALNLRFCAL